MVRLGIDLGGTKMEIIALDPAGRELLRRRIPTPGDGYQSILEAIASLVGWAERGAWRAGHRGHRHAGRRVPCKRCAEECQHRLSHRSTSPAGPRAAPWTPIRLANDANCLALSEAVDGAGAGAEVIFAVILGTGVGGGIVVQGRVLTGINAIAGEWGHNPLPWPCDDERPGPDCYCGKPGCIETFLSGPGLSRDYGRTAGEPLEAPEIAPRALAGDAASDAA